jgi:anti-sigma B factor antagonist
MQAPKKSMSLTISTRVEGTATVMDITGRVILENAPEFLKALMYVAKTQKPPRLVLNMTLVTFIDSAGVACLVEALKVCRDAKIGFALFGLGTVPMEVLKLTRLTTVFEVYQTEEEALRGTRNALPGART